MTLEQYAEQLKRKRPARYIAKVGCEFGDYGSKCGAPAVAWIQDYGEGDHLCAEHVAALVAIGYTDGTTD